MHRAAASLLLLWPAASCLAQSSTSSAELPRADAVVEPAAYVSLAPVPRGRTFDLAVVAKIRPGFHINAHQVLQEYLIPTALQVELPPGFQVLETTYPPGVHRKFKFSAEKLSVYEGSATLRMRLQVPANAPLGARRLALTLRYQACNEEACLPPVRLPIVAEFEIAPANAPTHLVNPAIFQPPSRTKKSSPR